MTTELSCLPGATREDWAWAARFVGEDILPAVTDNTRPRHPKTTLTVASHAACNKTPSRYTSDGQIVGIPSWTGYRATPNEIRGWALEPYLNILINCRRIHAVDIDVPDFDIAEQIQRQVFALLGYEKMPLRYRETVGKRTIFFEPTGVHDFVYSSLILPGDAGKIEFLAQGKQSVMFGVHPDSLPGQPDRYIMRDHENGFPQVGMETVLAMWEALRATYDPTTTSNIVRDSTRQRNAFVVRGHVAAVDPVVPYLYDNGHVLDELGTHKIAITCPWERMHTTKTGLSSTVWLAAGHNGAERGAFVCMHTSCQPQDGQNPTLRFLRHIGYREHEAVQTFSGEVAPIAPPEPEGVNALAAAIVMPCDPTFTLGLMRNSKGEIEKRVANLNEILRSHRDIFQFKFDRFTQISYARIGSSKVYLEVTDTMVSVVREIVERRFRLSFSPDEVSRSIDLVADAHSYDSAIDWIRCLRWDGQPRIARFAADVLKTTPTPYGEELGMYLWSALAGRIVLPGCKADISPILLSTTQGTGKSSLVQRLTPFSEWYVGLDLSARDADIYRQLRGKSAVELAELKGLNARGSDDMKAFLTQQVDSWIPKYKERETRVPRRCVFLGTDNRSRVLTDPTGNRRWAPIKVAVTGQFIDWPAFERERDQYWAEALSLLGEAPQSIIEHHASRLKSLAGPYIANATRVDPWYPEVSQWVSSQPAGTRITLRSIAAMLGADPKLERPQTSYRLRDVMSLLHLREVEPDVWLTTGMGL